MRKRRPALLLPSLLMLPVRGLAACPSTSCSSAADVSRDLGCCGYEADVAGARERKSDGRLSRMVSTGEDMALIWFVVVRVAVVGCKLAGTAGCFGIACKRRRSTGRMDGNE